MAEIAIAAAISAAVSAASYTLSYALAPKPKMAERGRLQGQLQIQDSSYGSMIPLIFGGDMGDGSMAGMRVAGNVHFLSDIRKEERVVPATGGGGRSGKGGGGGNDNKVRETTYYVDVGIMFGQPGEGSELELVRLYAGSDLIYDASGANQFDDDDDGDDQDGDGGQGEIIRRLITGALPGSSTPEPTYNHMTPPNPYDAGWVTRQEARYDHLPAPNARGEISATVLGGGYAALRWYPGNELQEPDPLITAEFQKIFAADAALGRDVTPAYLDRAYVVLQNFNISKYGAVPNFTAVVRNKNTKTAAQILTALCAMSGVDTATELDVSALGSSKVRGLAVTNRASVKDISAQSLALRFPFDWTQKAGKLTAVMRGGAAVYDIPATHLGFRRGAEGAGGAEAGGARRVQVKLKQNEAALPRSIEIKAFDPARGFEIGTAGARRQVVRSKKKTTVECNMALTVAEMRQIAERELETAWLEGRQAVSVSVPHQYARLVPAEVVTVTDGESPVSATHTVRVREITGSIPGTLQLVGVPTDAAVYAANPPASITLTSPGVPVPATLVGTFVESRYMRDRDGYAGELGFYVGVTSVGNGNFTGAAMHRDRGAGYEFVCHFPVRATMGRCATVLNSGSTTLDVDLYGDAELDSPGAGGVALGGGWVYAGGEALQYTSAAPVSGYANRWRLSGLTSRGGFNTTAKINTHAADERFVLMNEALRWVSVDRSEYDVARNYKFAADGMALADAAPVPYTFTAAGLKPAPPVLSAAQLDAGLAEFTAALDSTPNFSHLEVYTSAGSLLRLVDSTKFQEAINFESGADIVRKVKAVTRAGIASEFSNTFTFQVNTPSAPGGRSASLGAKGELVLSWQGREGETYEVSTTNNADGSGVFWQGAESRCIVPKAIVAANGTFTYTYYVRTLRFGKYSGFASITFVYTRPGPPSIKGRRSAGGDKGQKVEFTPPAQTTAPVDGYEVYLDDVLVTYLPAAAAASSPYFEWSDPPGKKNATKFDIVTVDEHGVKSSSAATDSTAPPAVAPPASFAARLAGRYFDLRWAAFGLTWQNLLGFALDSDNNLTRNTATGNSNGATSAETLSGDGFAQFTVTETASRFYGLTSLSSVTAGNHVQFGFYIDSGIYYSWRSTTGAASLFLAAAAGDVVRVAVEQGRVRLYINDVHVHTFADSPAFPLRAGVFVNAINQTVKGARLEDGRAREFELSRSADFTQSYHRTLGREFAEAPPVLTTRSHTRWIRAWVGGVPSAAVSAVVSDTAAPAAPTLTKDAANANNFELPVSVTTATSAERILSTIVQVRAAGGSWPANTNDGTAGNYRHAGAPATVPVPRLPHSSGDAIEFRVAHEDLFTRSLASPDHQWAEMTGVNGHTFPRLGDSAVDASSNFMRKANYRAAIFRGGGMIEWTSPSFLVKWSQPIVVSVAGIAGSAQEVTLAANPSGTTLLAGQGIIFRHVLGATTATAVVVTLSSWTPPEETSSTTEFLVFRRESDNTLSNYLHVPLNPGEQMDASVVIPMLTTYAARVGDLVIRRVRSDNHIAHGAAAVETITPDFDSAGHSLRAISYGDGRHRIPSAVGYSSGLGGYSYGLIDAQNRQWYFSLNNSSNTLSITAPDGGTTSHGAYPTGLELIVAVEGAEVKFYRAGVAVRTSATQPAYPVRFFRNPGFAPGTEFEGRGALVNSSGRKVRWQSVVNLNFDANDDFSKAAGTGNAYNAGAGSADAITRAFALDFEIASATTSTYYGVGREAAVAGVAPIADYAFGVAVESGQWLPVLNGANALGSGYAGTTAAGDKWRLADEGGVVRLRKNGLVVYTFSSAASYASAYHVLARAYNAGAALKGIRLSAGGARSTGLSIDGVAGTAELGGGLTVPGGYRFDEMAGRALTAISENKQFRGNDYGPPQAHKVTALGLGIVTVNEANVDDVVTVELTYTTPKRGADPDANFDSATRARVQVYDQFGKLVKTAGPLAFTPGEGRLPPFQHPRAYADPHDQARYAVWFENDEYGWSREAAWLQAGAKVSAPTYLDRARAPLSFTARPTTSDLSATIAASWRPPAINGNNVYVEYRVLGLTGWISESPSPAGSSDYGATPTGANSLPGDQMFDVRIRNYTDNVSSNYLRLRSPEVTFSAGVAKVTRAKSVSGTSVKLSYQRPDSASYPQMNVYRSTNGGAFSSLTGLIATASEYTDNTVAVGNTYRYFLIFYTGTGIPYRASEMATVTTEEAATTSDPSNLQVSVVSSKSLRATWAINSATGTVYLEYRLKGDPTWLVTPDAPSGYAAGTQEGTISNLASEATYEVRVRVSDAGSQPTPAREVTMTKTVVKYY
jgi:hypothetical protein